MAEKEKTEDKMDADAGTKLDMLLSHMDSFGKRMDALEEGRKADSARCDSFEDMIKSKKDEDKPKDEKKDAVEDGKPKEIVADKGKKDEDKPKAEDKKDEDKPKEEEKKDSDKPKEESHADSVSPAVMKMIDDVRRRLPAHVGDADYAALTACQAKADAVFQAFGDSAPRPLNGETPLQYRKRVATMLKVHSTDWKGVELSAIGDDQAFSIAEGRIYADAQAAATSPIDIPEGTMRAISSTDRNTGHRVTTFRGRSSFVRDFAQPRRLLTDLSARRRDEH